MALYAIGDTHLSLGGSKPMDVFGGGWSGYVDKLREGFHATVSPGDTVVICGDISWGMSLEEAREDFAFLDALPGGRKLLLKGNHDYWWMTAAKMKGFFQENGFSTLEIPGYTWAVFACRGSLANVHTLQDIHRKVFSEWLPQNRDYEIAAGYHIEMYSDPADYLKGVNDEGYYSEIWIPVRKK